MTEGPTPELRDSDTKLSWDDTRTEYKCRDAMYVKILGRVSAKNRKDKPRPTARSANVGPAARNAIIYQMRGEYGRVPRLFISGTELNRSMSVIVKGAESTKEVTFPGTTREARDGSFSEQNKKTRVLRSIVLNEGLEVLGGRRAENKQRYDGALSGS